MFKYKKIYLWLIILCLILIIIGCQKNNKQDYNTNTKKEKHFIVNKTATYTYDKMKSHIEKLNNRYSTIKVDTIGSSYLERNLYLLKFGSGNKKIIVVGGVHGREGLTSLLIMRMIEEYARNYKQDESIDEYDLKSIFNQVSIYFVPMLNPDGIEIAVKGIGNLKNKEFYLKANENSNDFKRWKANARGVDLNKQFKAHWESVKSKAHPHYESYKGPAPESEPESRALASLTKKEEFAVTVCFHHSGRVIYWYYNQTGKQLKRDYELAKAIGSINGYELVSAEDSNLRAAGYKDWFIKDFEKPGFTVEIGYKNKVERPLSGNKLSRYLNENRCVLLEIADRI